MQSAVVTSLYALAWGLALRLIIPPSQLSLSALIPLAIVAGLGFAIWRCGESITKQIVAVADSVGPVETARLLLRLPRSSDRRVLAGALDSEVMRANGWTGADRSRWLRAIGVSDTICIADEWIVTARSDGSILGSVSVTQVDRTAATCHVGWWMRGDARNKGYGTEAVSAVLGALHDHDFRRIMIGTQVENEPVKHVAEKVGAQRVEDAEHVLPDGSTVMSAWYVHSASPAAPAES